MKGRKANIGWLALVNVVYALAAIIGWPIYLVLVAARKKYRHRLLERWGFLPRRDPGRMRFWVHAISVGEGWETLLSGRSEKCGGGRPW